LDTRIKEKIYQSSEVEARYPVTVFTAQGYLEGETQLINSCGALIRCQHPPALRETATVNIELSEDESLLVEAEVVWVDFSDSDQSQEITPRGMVVRFMNLSTLSRQRLRNVVAKHYVKKVEGLSGKRRYTDQTR
jgi:hypothetical protein